MRFENRDEAACLLAEQLLRLKAQQPLILGIPRGGVPMAKIIAERLGCQFDLVLVRKLRTPEEPELAMGAVDEAGNVYTYGHRAAVSPQIYADEVAAQVAEIGRRRQLYSAKQPAVPATGHTAIIVDDGIATGASMVAAVRAVRAQRPLRIVVAVPVSARDALNLVKSYADEAVCLYTPKVFFSVGDFYDDFSTVADSDVVELLEGRAARRES